MQIILHTCRLRTVVFRLKYGAALVILVRTEIDAPRDASGAVMPAARSTFYSLGTRDASMTPRQPRFGVATQGLAMPI